MHSFLTKLLKKRGIENPAELSQEEKQVFEEWNLILNKETLTIEDISRFCESQVSLIEGKWALLDTENAKKAELIPYYVCYKTLARAITSPKVAREALEKQLIELLK